MHCGLFWNVKPTVMLWLSMYLPQAWMRAPRAAFRAGCSLADLLRLAVTCERVEHFPRVPKATGGLGGGLLQQHFGGHFMCIHNAVLFCEGVIIFPGPSCWKSVAGRFCCLKTRSLKKLYITEPYSRSHANLAFSCFFFCLLTTSNTDRAAVGGTTLKERCIS